MTSAWEEGDSSASICFLGEAPGAIEVADNKPLCGPSGDLFDACLMQAGIRRSDCYILNLFPFRVWKDAGDTIRDGKKEILWTKKEGLTERGAAAAEHSLARLSASGANVIVPLGGTVLSVLYGDTRILKWRGSVLSPSIPKCAKILPTIHPAASLRGAYLYRYMIASDFVKVKEEALTPDINLPKRTFYLEPTYSQILEYLREIKGKVASDIEVLNNQISCLSVAPSPGEAMILPFVGDRGKHIWTPEEEMNIWLAYARIMEDPEIMKINQNIIFDMMVLLSQNNIHTRGSIGDPMIAYSIMYPDFPKGLDFLCSMDTREPYYKDDGKLWRKPWNDLSLFWEYCCKDSTCAFELWEVYEALLMDEGYLISYEDTVRMFPALLFMMTRGVLVDTARLEETKKNVKVEIETLKGELLSAADYEFNPASPKQCMEYFYKHKGVKAYVHRTTKKPTIDDKALSRIFRKTGLREAKLIQGIRGLSKLLGTYLEMGLDEDGRLRCSYNPRGTRTGRLSSSATIFGLGTNMQNLDPRFKGFLTVG